MTSLCDGSALDLAGMLRRGEVSAREVLDAHLARIDLLGPQLNAVVTRIDDAARRAAVAADEAFTRSGPLGPLHGLPVAHKDLALTAGIRTTFGSPIFADFVPDVDALIVERMRAAGAITVGKTNTPEFGAGSQTFNPVFGPTRNPYAPDRTCGGSSGGAAVALRTGMVALADGSDMGGSLRNPASFCNVVGFRPSPGRVPQHPARWAWGTLAVEGPMGRTVADVALLLSVLAGPDPRVAVALEAPGSVFAPPLAEVTATGLRVAVSPDLGGLPVEPAVRAVVADVARALEGAGARVTVDDPGWAGADEAFEILRAFQFELGFGALADTDGDRMKATVRANIAAGRALRGVDVARAERLRSEVFVRTAGFFERYDVLIAPVTQVVPFPIEVEYPTVVDGTPMDGYIEWMRSCSRVTVSSCPAASVPAGFDPDGLPIGVQVIGPHRRDRHTLRVAALVEALCGAGARAPGCVPVA